MKFDRVTLLKVQSEIDQALRAIAEKYGSEIEGFVDVRRSTDGNFIRIMKTDIRVKSVAVPAMVLKTAQIGGDSALERALKRIGVTKMTNAKGERIVDYKPNRPKYPFVFEGARGGRWKASEQDIKIRFGGSL